MMSNSALRKGGATLFFTTFTRTWLPITSSPSFSWLARRMSSTYGSIEFQGVTAGGCFRIAEHDTDFFAQLVDEDTGGIGFADGLSQFTKSLRHQSRL